LDKFADPDNLHAVFEQLRKHGVQAAGIDGVEYRSLTEGKARTMLRKLSTAIHSGMYRARDPKIVRLAKPHGGFREISVQAVADRVVAKAMELAITPLVHRETILLRQSRFQLFRCWEHLIRQHGYHWLTTDDIEKSFGRVHIASVMDCFAERIDHPDLFRMIQQISLAHLEMAVEKGATVARMSRED